MQSHFHQWTCGWKKHHGNNKIPSLAESIVPAVVGDTNLLWLNCCMINPLILITTPAIIILASRGIRLLQKIFDCSLVIWKMI